MEEWLDQLIPSLADKDLSNLNIDDIAKITKKSKSTIYEYFESKESIIYTAVSRKIKKLDGLPKSSHSSSPITLFEALINWLIKHLNDVSFSFLYQLENDYIEAWALVKEFMSKLLQMLKKLYLDGIKKGEFRHVSVDLLLVIDQYFITKWLSLQANKLETVDKLIVDYVDIRLNGILASPFSKNE